MKTTISKEIEQLKEKINRLENFTKDKNNGVSANDEVFAGYNDNGMIALYYTNKNTNQKMVIRF